MKTDNAFKWTSYCSQIRLMLIQRIDLDNIEKFFCVYSRKENFLFEEDFRSVRRKEHTEESSLLVYSDKDEYEHTKEMFEIVEQIIATYKRDKRKSRFLRECIIKPKTWQETREHMSICRRTYFLWREEILNDTAIIAVERGLLKTNL